MTRLKNLSHIDFEELCRDILGAETGKRFSAFGPGPDGGVDGRHSKGEEATVLQCKHYAGSTFSNLKASVKKEIPKLSALKPKRYLLCTSHSLTPQKSDEIAELIGDYLQSPEDVWGQEDLEEAIRRHPEIEKSHMKLWLSSTAVLERILHSGLETYTQATKDEILGDLKVYVRNPSFDEAVKKLEREKILIVSGPPGVGKTTLARMVAYHYLNDGWNFYAINSLEDGFSKIDDSKPTIFFFDDFLGRIELDRQSLLQRDTALATFVRRVRNSKNARFILTTRAHIFEEARNLSDHVDDRRLQLAKYLLDVGTYTREIKSHILFNHLSVSSLSQGHFASLLEDDWLKKIVDHKNYNPRLIASVSSDCLDDVDALDYPKYIYHALENPDLVWSKPYRSLDMRSQNLLVALFFGNQFGQEIDELRENYLELHRTVSAYYSQPTKPGDFETALRALESGFISISGKRVSFINPSVRDFLKAYLTEREYLNLLPQTARRVDWAASVWRHVKDLLKTHPPEVKRFVQLFRGVASRIEETPSQRHIKSSGNFYSVSSDDLSLSDRIELLFDWWQQSEDEYFLDRCLEVLASGKVELVPWHDGRAFPELHWQVSNFVDSEFVQKDKLLRLIEQRLVHAIEGGLPVDEILSVVEAVDEFMADTAPDEVTEALEGVVGYEFSETEEAISHLNTESELSEHMEHLEQLAKVTGINPDSALQVVSEKLVQYEQPDYDEHRGSFTRPQQSQRAEFSDDALVSLFSNLVEQ
ncbi:ATP-binding protein [Thiosulfatihalobacter marinus]|uniref:ATP-binding protein n=1 Tax=Thiosulfatihalobacter marinus TaxID=2792481 RepID=UPI0018D8F608|nr:ATP-binding protein [Thiosulfatihalobacter marinus]